MKRRDFLAATAALSLFASPPAFAKKKNTAPVSRAKSKKTPPPKPAARPTEPTSAAVAPAERPTETRNVISLPDEPTPRWQSRRVDTEISVAEPTEPFRLWLPLAHYKDTAWQRSLAHSWQGNFSQASVYRDPVSEMEVFVAEWSERTDAPWIKFSSEIATQDRHFDITRRGSIAERAEILRRSVQPSALYTLDGIIYDTAIRAIGRIKDPLAMAKALYDWVITNTHFELTGSGIGEANIAERLQEGAFRGRSADISRLFVALCRSVGIPARPVYGLKMGSSRLFGSLGTAGELNDAYHCRAEFYIPGYSWIGVDPADVRKALQQENLSPTDSRVSVFKKLLFGFWEMNWFAFNSAEDVILKHSSGSAHPHFVYPIAEHLENPAALNLTARLRLKIRAMRIEE